MFKKRKVDCGEYTAFKLTHKGYAYNVWDNTCNAASSRISRSSSNSLPIVQMKMFTNIFWLNFPVLLHETTFTIFKIF